MGDLIQSTPPRVLVPLHALSVVACSPGHLLFELGEGYLFGFKRGLMLAFAGKSLGATGAFVLARSALNFGGLREKLRDKMRSWPMACKVADGVEQGGFASAFFVRIAPVPCFIKNYS